MTVAFDATFLLHLFREPGSIAVPRDSAGELISFAKERIEALSGELQRTETRIVVAAPALGEGAQALYTDDKDQRTFAEKHGLIVRGLADLPIPDSTAQHELFGAPGANADSDV